MAKHKTKNRLLIFAKAPVPGEVKTRLSPLLAADQSALLHQNLVEYCLHTMMAVDNIDVELWGGSEHPWLSNLAEQAGVELFQQSGADLGWRMYHAFEEALGRSENVVLIGTDCPYLTADIIQQAFTFLEANDAVIGPAEDGGYVLLGLKRLQLSVFEHINWGTDKVLEQSLDRMRSASQSWAQLPVLSDIDRPQDFLQLQALMPALVRGVTPKP